MIEFHQYFIDFFLTGSTILDQGVYIKIENLRQHQYADTKK